jgi:hypothetical protein
MVIEIHRPELEALITERLLSGPFQTVTDLLWDALKSTPVKSEPPRPQPKNVIEFFRKVPQNGKNTEST